MDQNAGKGHHCYNCKYTLCQEFECLREPEHQHSKHVASVQLRKPNERMKVIGHILDALTELVHGLISKWKISDSKNLW